MGITQKRPTTKETLFTLYVTEHLPLATIATRLGVSVGTVSRWLHECDIPVRPRSVIRKSPGKEELARLYEHRSAMEVANHLGVLEGTVLRWLRLYGIQPHKSHGLTGYQRSEPNTTCERCNRSFHVAAHMSGKTRFCSKECLYPVHTRQCAHCGKVYAVKQSAHTRAKHGYCSIACRKAAFGPRVSIPCHQCGTLFEVTSGEAERGDRKYCTRRCAGLAKFEGDNASAYMQKKLATGYRTDIESLIEAVLKEIGIEYLFEYRVGRHFIDFALPSLHIALEADGWHHENEKARARDKNRDTELSKQGWKVVRLNWRDINHDARGVVLNALEHHS